MYENAIFAFDVGALDKGTMALAPGFIPVAPDSRFFTFKYSFNPSNICSHCDVDEQQKCTLYKQSRVY